jgi:hypothetical protein
MAGQLSPSRDEEDIARVSMPDLQKETSKSNRFFYGCLADGHRLARYPWAWRSVLADTYSLSRTKLFWADSALPTRSLALVGFDGDLERIYDIIAEAFPK